MLVNIRALEYPVTFGLSDQICIQERLDTSRVSSSMFYLYSQVAIDKSRSIDLIDLHPSFPVLSPCYASRTLDVLVHVTLKVVERPRSSGGEFADDSQAAIGRCE